MNVLFCGGGTAGHVTPAVAIGSYITKKRPEAKIAHVGRIGGEENKLAASADFKLYEINMTGLKRKLSKDNINFIKNLFLSRKSAAEILSDFKPDVVIGTGGYVSFPVIREAHKRGIPTVIHESNSALGLASRMLLSRVDLLLLGMDMKAKHKNAHYVGNPVREGFGRMPRHEAKRRLGIPKDKTLIVSVGGSIGAEQFNSAVLEMMNKNLSDSNIYHIHSCGRRYYNEVSNKYPLLTDSKGRQRILPFIEDMITAFAAADIVISRSGAMTLSEIAAIRSYSIAERNGRSPKKKC